MRRCAGKQILVRLFSARKKKKTNNQFHVQLQKQTMIVIIIIGTNKNDDEATPTTSTLTANLRLLLIKMTIYFFVFCHMPRRFSVHILHFIDASNSFAWVGICFLRAKNVVEMRQ